MIRALVIASLVLAACASPDDEHSCELGIRQLEVQAVDRKLLGQGAPYAADGALRAREAELAHSQRARRQVAWATVRKVLEPVPLAENLPELPPGMPTEVPRWHTWHNRDDISRMFHHLYEELGPAGRAERVHFSDQALDDALVWNTDYVDTLVNWPEERWLEYLHAIDQATEVSGLGGIGRVGYSPATARHLLASYPEILQCEYAGVPAPFAEGEASPRRLASEPLALSGCSSRTYGPYFVADGDTLEASLVGGDQSVAGAVVVGYRDDQVACRAVGDRSCQLTGPGLFHVAVTTDQRPLDQATLAVDYRAAEPPWAACLDGAFAENAVLVKTEWHRAQLGFQLPVYDTSADGLVRRMAAGDFTWGEGESTADPGADDIYTVELQNGNIFRLAGLHIMTKELDHWLWITLWWSAEPDRDFGADRPVEIADLPGPWRNYKMCVATAFVEGDPDPSGGFAGDAPSLARALEVVHRGAGGPSWCSNPYLEQGPGNAATNCVGCHQHGGSGLDVASILSSPDEYPAHGRTQVRNNFPLDYSFAADSGDRLGRLFADVVEYYDSFEQ